MSLTPKPCGRAQKSTGDCQERKLVGRNRTLPDMRKLHLLDLPDGSRPVLPGNLYFSLSPGKLEPRLFMRRVLCHRRFSGLLRGWAGHMPRLAETMRMRLRLPSGRGRTIRSLRPRGAWGSFPADHIPFMQPRARPRHLTTSRQGKRRGKRFQTISLGMTEAVYQSSHAQKNKPVSTHLLARAKQHPSVQSYG